MPIQLRWANRRQSRQEHSRPPDLVDLDEMAERLSLPSAIISTLCKRRFFPQPHFQFRQRDLWSWPHVLAWGRQAGRSMRKSDQLKALPKVDLVGMPEIARRLDVPQRTLRFWLLSGKLVESDYQWSSDQVWTWSTIETWSKGMSRRPSETPLWPRLAATVAEARGVLAGNPIDELDRLRNLLEKLAGDEVALLGKSTVPTTPDLSGGEDLLVQFEEIELRLRELSDQLPTEM